MVVGVRSDSAIGPERLFKKATHCITKAANLQAIFVPERGIESGPWKKPARFPEHDLFYGTDYHFLHHSLNKRQILHFLSGEAGQCYDVKILG